jgi:hypothetical protein
VRECGSLIVDTWTKRNLLCLHRGSSRASVDELAVQDAAFQMRVIDEPGGDVGAERLQA